MALKLLFGDIDWSIPTYECKKVTWGQIPDDVWRKFKAQYKFLPAYDPAISAGQQGALAKEDESPWEPCQNQWEPKWVTKKLAGPVTTE